MTTKQFFALKNKPSVIPREMIKTYLLPEVPEGEHLSDEELVQWQLDRCIYPTIPTRIGRQNLETIDGYDGEF